MHSYSPGIVLLFLALGIIVSTIFFILNWYLLGIGVGIARRGFDRVGRNPRFHKAPPALPPPTIARRDDPTGRWENAWGELTR